MTPIERLLVLLKEEDVTGIFIRGASSIRYFTGFTGDDSLLYLDCSHKIIITDSRYTLQVKNEAPECTVIEHKGGFASEIVKWKLCGCFALDGDHFTFSEQSTLAVALPEVTWKNVNLAELRQVKTEEELKNITRAVEISDQAFIQLMPDIHEGVKEAQLAAKLEYNMRKLGSEKTAFATIVASGCRSALPHGLATEKVLAKGDFVTFDFGAVYNGYCSDITRTLVVGYAADWQKEIYSIVLQANLLGESILQAGVAGCQIDAQVRKFIADKGYGAYFGHGLGHGVGLDIHEQPVLSARNIDKLLPINSVVTVEPGIYIPGKGGVRIEDTVVVTKEGCRVLTTVPKQLQEIS